MRSWRKVLLPFSVLYRLVTDFRNQRYNAGNFNSVRFRTPVIAIGNLNVGGTGKTPHAAYLLNLFSNQRTALVSRGYGRHTTGLLEVKTTSTPELTGDEPLMLKKRFPDAAVWVCEKRVKAIDHLERDFEPEVVILDDAFQHRAVKAGMYILLTAYHDLFTDDYVLPAGNLRESRDGARRATLVVVTKCPEDLSEEAKQIVIRKIKRYTEAQVLFSYFTYGEPVPMFESSNYELKDKAEIVLVTGIADPGPLVNHLSQHHRIIKHHAFKDHHNFTASDVSKVNNSLKKYPNTALVTTEKDAMRMEQGIFAKDLINCPVFYLPIDVRFNSGDEHIINTATQQYARLYQTDRKAPR